MNSFRKFEQFQNTYTYGRKDTLNCSNNIKCRNEELHEITPTFENYRRRYKIKLCLNNRIFIRNTLSSRRYNIYIYIFIYIYIYIYI